MLDFELNFGQQDNLNSESRLAGAEMTKNKEIFSPRLSYNICQRMEG
jgi:hypothetical protein